jgi:hypothetical protein
MPRLDSFFLCVRWDVITKQRAQNQDPRAHEIFNTASSHVFPRSANSITPPSDTDCESGSPFPIFSTLGDEFSITRGDSTRVAARQHWTMGQSFAQNPNFVYFMQFIVNHELLALTTSSSAPTTTAPHSSKIVTVTVPLKDALDDAVIRSLYDGIWTFQ